MMGGLRDTGLCPSDQNLSAIQVTKQLNPAYFQRSKFGGKMTKDQKNTVGLFARILKTSNIQLKFNLVISYKQGWPEKDQSGLNHLKKPNFDHHKWSKLKNQDFSEVNINKRCTKKEININVLC